ncbi:flagellar basal-body rod protein FlgF [Rosenbergiella australiborealis]|uniref:flagellar basal-body rod protein FlgF n=1 Tax=Rosenbergiella australiborealis TaxID=1544696 RepID=UPI001F4EE2ED|nr:flagellar basal-body rod protein FlgF [Rosenbergiella australiborealis]
MDRLLYTALSGANVAQQQQQIHANNLANVNTEGFRADLALAQQQALSTRADETRVLSTEQPSGVDLSVGAIQSTGRNLDVAIQGQGYLTLVTGAGEAYTRDGQLTIDQQGQMYAHGYPVSGDNGPIVLPPFSSVSIGADGTISIVPQESGNTTPIDVDRLKLVNPPAASLSKNSQGLLVSSNRNNPTDETVSVVSGHLEGSNVSAIGEMLASMSVNRQFEAQIKMMKTADDLASAGNQLLRNS